MPKQTFFNLSETKKNKIIEAAVDEFSEYSYDESNISRIIKQAGIPRGSFYQYFEDKEDIYLYIFGILTEEKKKTLLPCLQTFHTQSFFKTYKDLYIAGMDFAIKYPKYAQIAQLLITRPNQAIKEKFYHKGSDEADAMFYQLVERGKSDGELKKDFDTRLVSRILTAISTYVLQDYIEEWGEYKHKELLELINDVIHILEYGIKKKEKNS